MKRVIVLTAALLGVILTSRAEATEVGTARPFGLGFALGTPTSIVGKYFLDSVNAVDFGLAFWRYGRGRACDDRLDRPDCDDFGMGLAVDYLWHDTLARGTAKLDWHIGPGGRLWIGDDGYYDDDADFALAARMPVGLDLTFAKPDFLEVFVELAPILVIVPGVEFDVEAFLGVRFYF